MQGQVVATNSTDKSVLIEYIGIAKPGIVGLTLMAALTGIYFGNPGIQPDWQLIFLTLLTLGLATAGSCMMNNAYDRDIDALMKRTSSRAVAAGKIPAKDAMITGLLLAIGSVLWMGLVVNPLAAIITSVGVIGYVGVYTMLAKRRTPWANQLGGIAGAVPPMVGYVAVTGELGAAAWVLFIIMVVWQQPHALSLALKYRKDYAKAGVPVIPVAKGVAATKKRIAIYCLALIPVTLLPYAFGMAGDVYLATAIIFSMAFFVMAIRFLRSEKDCDMRLFAFSIVYLIAVFGAMVIDANPVVSAVTL
jgi:protoheme IX farnesyltransferase